MVQTGLPPNQILQISARKPVNRHVMHLQGNWAISCLQAMNEIIWDSPHLELL